MRRTWALAAIATIAIVGLGAVWWTWLVQELAGPITTSGHHDFFAFYAAATLVHAGHANLLYDASTLTAIERQIFPHPTGYAGYMPFLNPPSAAAALSPLAALSEQTARFVWLGISTVVAVACALVLTAGRDLRIRALAILLLLASFPAFQTLIEGQWSFVLLLAALCALAAARRNHPWLAGILVGVLWLKPPLLLLVLVWLLITRRWRIAAGAVLAVLALTVATLPWAGIDANLAYVHYLGGVSLAHAAGGGAAGQTAWEGAFPNMEGLIGLAATFVGQQNPVSVDVITGIMALALVAFFVATTHSHWAQRPLPVPIAMSAVCLGLLLDPHLYAQDCVLLLVLVALALPLAHSARAQVALLVAGALLMDLSAIDTLWLQLYSLTPWHLLTYALIAGVVGLLGPGAKLTTRLCAQLRPELPFSRAARGPAERFPGPGIRSARV